MFGTLSWCLISTNIDSPMDDPSCVRWFNNRRQAFNHACYRYELPLSLAKELAKWNDVVDHFTGDRHSIARRP